MAKPASDFRSDTVTRPSPRMRAAMADAEVGDDVLDGDPTVRRLERAAAKWLGKEAALFVPSGTMANQCAVAVHTRPGDEVILAADAHMLSFESGALGALHGVQTATVQGAAGVLTREQVEARIRAESVHSPRTGLVCLEQTHMASGGRVIPLQRFHGPVLAARDNGVPVHLDGARLANAVVASGVPASQWALQVDTVSLCFSKGLGAPVGSVLAGSAVLCERAKRFRKRFGGWMRQSGILAAAALVALEENVERLAVDHALAQQLAARLDELEFLSCPAADVDTNIVLVRVDHPELSATEVVAKLGENGVKVLPLDGRTLRFVTHMDVGEADVERVVRAMRALI
ncbi:MAG: GntG family PLP-dependent aldolase [Planctomycetota bacterium]